MKTLLAILLSFLTIGAAAQPYDAVVAGIVLDNCVVTPPPTDPRLEWVSDGMGRPTMPGDVVAAASRSRVLAAIQSGDSFEVRFVEFGVSTPFAASPSAYRVLSIAAARSGTVYVLAASIRGEQRAIVVFKEDGALAGVHSLPTLPNATAIDLAVDQCTLWIAAGNRVARYNACTSTLLSDFITGMLLTGVRILPDGGAVVIQDGVLRRHDAGGLLIQSYPLEGGRRVAAIGLVDGGTHILAAGECTGELTTIRLESGAVTFIADIFTEGPTSVVGYASWTSALGSAHLAVVPTATEATLALFVVLIALAAFLRLR